jgi:hypothetical protein
MPMMPSARIWVPKNLMSSRWGWRIAFLSNYRCPIHRAVVDKDALVRLPTMGKSKKRKLSDLAMR